MYTFPVPTILRINNLTLLYTGDYKSLSVGPRDRIDALPDQYRALIHRIYTGVGEAERAWADLQRLAQERMHRIPDNAVAQDLAWLVGQRATGGHHYREAQSWQKKAQLNSAA